jgi:hypothetical protein
LTAFRFGPSPVHREIDGVQTRRLINAMIPASVQVIDPTGFQYLKFCRQSPSSHKQAWYASIASPILVCPSSIRAIDALD